jgi:hypothetical protein
MDSRPIQERVNMLSDDNMQLDELNQTESPTDKSSQVNDAPDDWQQLDGRSQDRFKKLSQQKKELLAEKQNLERELEKQRNQYIPMPPDRSSRDPKFVNDDERLAYQRLTTDLHIPTEDKVQTLVREEIENVKSRLYLDNLHDKLETELSREKELPAYDRDEVEDYMRRTGIMNPKAAYEQLYRDEVISHEAQKLVAKKKEAVQTERTRSRNGVSEPWTRERLRERAKQPDWLEFFKKNREKILRLQSEFTD